MQTRNYMAAIAGSALMLLSTTSSAWTIQENYDGQSTGSLCAPMWGDGSDTTVSNEQSVSGNNSCRMAITSGGLKWGGGFNFTSALHKGDSVWVRFRLYVPAGFNYTVDPGSGGHLKFIRMSIRDGGGTVGRLDWLWSRPNALPSYITGLERDKCSTNCLYDFGNAAAKPAMGTWETYEMYAKFDHTAADAGGMGRLLFWKNGKLIGERTDRPTMWQNSVKIGNVILFSHWNGGSPATQKLYLDDMIVTNATPGKQDSNGNPYIGVGSYVFVAPPNPPSGVSSP